MKTRTFNIYLMLLICIGFAACQGSDKTSKMQADSAPVGDVDSAERLDTLKEPRNITHLSKVEEDGAAFINSAAIGGMMEVDLGKVALEKSASADIKKFAELMVADHGKANTELESLAKKLGILAPQEYPADVKSHIEAMKKYSGKEFDIRYMEMMVNDHKKTLDLFRSASSLSPEVKDFAAKTLPILEKHHQMAKEIRAGLK